MTTNRRLFIENGYCADCEVLRTEAGEHCAASDDGSHDFSWNGCWTCDGEHWIVNDVDDSGPWRICPGCNASGNFPNPFVFVEATRLEAEATSSGREHLGGGQKDSEV